MQETVYKIRYAECDLFGHLNHTSYFDYLQEGLLAAAGLLGYSIERLHSDGLEPRFTGATVEYLKPLRFAQKIRLGISLVDCGRYSCRLQIALIPDNEEKPAARTEAELIFIRNDNPAPIPEAVRNGLFSFPPAAGRVGLDLPDSIGHLPEQFSFSTNRRVTNANTNPNGLLNMTAGVSFFEDCGLQQCNSVGWPFSRMAEEGIGIVARKYTLRYLLPLPMDSRVKVTTWLSTPKGVSIDRHYTMKEESTGKPACLAHCRWIFFDLKRQRPMRIPQAFDRDFGHLIHNE